MSLQAAGSDVKGALLSPECIDALVTILSTGGISPEAAAAIVPCAMQIVPAVIRAVKALYQAARAPRGSAPPAQRAQAYRSGGVVKRRYVGTHRKGMRTGQLKDQLY